MSVNYFPFHMGDYASHTAHLEPMEDLAYRRMLDAYYLHEKPLPATSEAVARLIRMRDHVAAVASVLSEFFTLDESGHRHERCDAELSKMQDKQAKAKASAQASVNARRTNAQRTLNERSTNAELPTPTPTPTPYSVTSVTDGKPSLTPDEIIFTYGVPLLVNAGSTDKAARSFLGGLRKGHGDAAVVDALRDCLRAKPIQPIEWLAAILPPKGAPPRRNKQEELEDSNRAVVARLLEKEGFHGAQ